MLWEHSLNPRVGARVGPDCGGQAECREAPGEECSPRGGQRGLWGLLGCCEEAGVNGTRSLLTGEPCASSP